MSKGDSEELVRIARSVIDRYEHRAGSGSFGANLHEFRSQIKRLESAIDEFEFGGQPPKRIPYSNVTKKGFSGDEETTEEHESFGLLQFSRISGGARLFGSHLDSHQHFVSLSIFRATTHHSLSYDRHHPRGKLIEVWLSAAQFAEAITTMNHGVGSPCTLRRLRGVSMEEVPEEAQAEHLKIRDGFKSRIGDIAAKMVEARDQFRAIIEGAKSISKGRAREMVKVLDKAAQELVDNAPFVVDQFRESTDKVVTSAKAEIEAFAQAAIYTRGEATIEMGNDLRLEDGKYKIGVDDISEIRSELSDIAKKRSEVVHPGGQIEGRNYVTLKPGQYQDTCDTCESPLPKVEHIGDLYNCPCGRAYEVFSVGGERQWYEHEPISAD